MIPATGFSGKAYKEVFMTKGDYRLVGRGADGSMLRRVWLLHQIGRIVGVQFKIGGWPYGASYKKSITWQPNDSDITQAACGNGM